MKPISALALLPLRILLLACLSCPAATNDAAILGFAPESVGRQRALESRFDGMLQRDDLRDWMKRMTAHPHHLGSPYNHELTEFIAAQFRSWGYQTEIEQFDVLLFPTPKGASHGHGNDRTGKEFTASLARTATPGRGSTSSLVTSNNCPPLITPFPSMAMSPASWCT